MHRLTVHFWLLGLAFSHPSPEADPKMPRQQQHGVFAPHFDKDETAAAVFEAEEEDRPHFDDRLVQNLTAIRGRDIDLTCKVYNLGNKTLSWIISSADKLSILSVGRYTYTSDLRFQPVMRDDSTDDSETWTLRIRRVKLEDEAKYECQINTKPEKSRHIYLRVVGEFSRSSLLFSAALCRLIPL